LLEGAGHSALFVGGCVRNTLLEAQVSDLDLATDARPDRVLALAQDAGVKAVPTGIEHGTVTLVYGHEPVEVTTWRRDVETFGRHAVIAFADRVEDDAARRDFTMNALYMDIRGQIIDPLGGLPDLRARKVRFVGEAAARVAEDYLRILRFFRFHAWYGDAAAGLDADGLAACAAGAEGLAQISQERIGAELVKLMSAPDPAPAVASMAQAGILARVLPGATADALALLVHLEGDLPPDSMRRLAALTDADLQDQLRLSRVKARRHFAIAHGARGGDGAGALGYRLGAEPARDALLVRAALMGQPHAPQAMADANAGAEAVFPLSAQDLMPERAGVALGRMLKQLELRWIESGFTLDRASLLDRKDDDVG
jgi:poly(A) polymerase